MGREQPSLGGKNDEGACGCFTIRPRQLNATESTMSDVAARNSLALARAFLAEDPDPASRAELAAVVAAAEGGDPVATADLADRFAGVLQFGTAGLRGRIGPGTARMNRVVVMRATWGLGRYLLEEGPLLGLDAELQGVVIGFDGRRMSRQFAEDTASVLAGLGIPAWLFDTVAPTPLSAFAVSWLGAAAGVMVTASHNPPADNGYKVYFSNGAQIIPPHDSGIAACIARAPSVASMARPTPPQAATAGLRKAMPAALEQAYLDGIRANSLHPDVLEDGSLRVVYTAMHGVGHRLVVAALRQAGLEGLVTVPAQTEPDGAFPTVAFPNPEEPGAMDLALALAAECGADLVVANDPDADRLAVAVPASDATGYRMLSGNEVGVLLGADCLKHADAALASVAGRPKLVVVSLVSSTMLGRIAHDLGARCAETLTGFKWIANTAMECEAHNGEAFLMGYEEALGYSVGPLVRDKDGVSAVVRIAELVAHLRREGRTLHDELRSLELAHGQSVALTWSVRLPGAEGAARIGETMDRLRREPLDELGGVAVVRRYDLREGTAWARDAQAPPMNLPPADVLLYFDADGTRLIVRPSGTEPKVKLYLEAAGSAKDASELDGERERLKFRLEAIRSDVESRLGLV